MPSNFDIYKVFFELQLNKLQDQRQITTCSLLTYYSIKFPIYYNFLEHFCYSFHKCFTSNRVHPPFKMDWIFKKSIISNKWEKNYLDNKN